MVLMAGYDLPLRAIRQQIVSALDVVVHLERMHDGTRKVTSITEIQRMESDMVTLQELYQFELDGVASDRSVVGQLDSTGLRPTFLDKFERRGVKVPGWTTKASAKLPQLVARGTRA
jgi:pilus assembly protein CpaF